MLKRAEKSRKKPKKTTHSPQKKGPGDLLANSSKGLEQDMLWGTFFYRKESVGFTTPSPCWMGKKKTVSHERGPEGVGKKKIRKFFHRMNDGGRVGKRYKESICGRGAIRERRASMGNLR